ncbi:MAG: glucosidase [Nitrospiraceae bacterium]|nr:MAG: glucosidase [Nitrospiraceae bacterium]
MEKMTAEEKRIAENRDHKVFWKKWGPYLSERQWGTVREDYSENGDAWKYFPHDHARSRVYRWGEDGLAGISDIKQNLCFALALWNGKDQILKERLFGLNPYEGNHGEDVKELYYYLDNTPTHSYMKYLYKYPQQEFPYQRLTDVNRSRSRNEPEYELSDTGLFDENKYFDIFVEYAKDGPEDILIKIEIFNRGKETADITVLPTLWFRNTWAFGQVRTKPSIKLVTDSELYITEAAHEDIGAWYLHAEKGERVMFTENETNTKRLFNTPNASPHVKDAFHDAVIRNNYDLFRGRDSGTKCALVYRYEIPGGKSKLVRLRLANRKFKTVPFGRGFDEIFERRISEANEFYRQFEPDDPVSDVINVQRQAFAGLLWSRQYYNYELETWLNGDKGQPAPPESRKHGRNYEWQYLFNRDIISMPDKWEYPWYASWDLAFHCIPLSRIEPDFAKKQLILFLREWYMHPNGQLPAYEWNFSDVNPPVHAWAALKIYQLRKRETGEQDTQFLKRVFHKLLLNFTWWVNRKDSEGHNIFQGGFLGLDNIGAFDRSRALPAGGHIEQADGTSWMGMYALNLMDMALEIAQEDPSYEDTASKFFEHFVHIAESLNSFGEHGLWHEEDGFYYDVMHLPDGSVTPLRVRSLVGLTSLFAVSVIDKDLLGRLKGFRKRLLWFRNNRKHLDKYLAIEELSEDRDLLLSLIPKKRLVRILQKMLDENEFLSAGGIRSISRHHKDHPFIMKVIGEEYRVGYEPAESVAGLFGGNSNWRGPVWIPMNYLFIESLKKYYQYYGDTMKVEFPSGSGDFMNLWEVAKKLSQRITSMFFRDENGKRPVHGDYGRYRDDPHFRDLVLFHEYFHGDTCKGLGASHQTGWTGLVAEMIEWCWCEIN